MPLDARTLRMFLAVADHGGVGRAAVSLGLTQPAVSKALRRLEVELGAALFERHATGVRLTEYGRALEPRARLITAESQRALEEIRTMRGLSSGTLKIGGVASVMTHLVPRALAGLTTRFPGLEVQVVEGLDDRLTTALLDSEIDVAIGVEIEEDDQLALVGSLRWRDHVTVVAAANHPLRERPGLSVRDLVSEAWVMPPERTSPRRAFSALFRQADVDEPRIAATTRSIVALKALVAEAGYLTLMPRPLLAPERAAGRIDTLPVPGGTRPRRFGVFRRRFGVLPAPTQALVAELRPLIVDLDRASTRRATNVRHLPY
jgi:DNA-binding transcriptional LysR family regulator